MVDHDSRAQVHAPADVQAKWEAVWARADRDKAYLVPVSIWKDPEFTGLRPMSQLFYFYEMSMAANRRYNLEELTTYFRVPYAEAADALGDLIMSKFGVACRKRWASAPRRYMAPAVKAAIFERDGHRCLHCGATEKLTVDHVYPYSLGGTDEPANLQTLCKYCNSRKGARV